MKKRFIKKRALFNFAFLLLTVAVTLGCNNYVPESKPIPNITPNYLLTGTYEATSGVLDYYDIGDGKYAVAANDTFVSGSAIVIPDEYNDSPVTGIMHNAFYDLSISSITIPVGITTIDFEAFLYCDIEQVVVPYTVNRIGDAAFYSSTLEKISFVNSNAEDTGSACSCDDPKPIPDDLDYSTLTTIPAFCFFNCKNLESISLPASIEEIAEEAFNGCSALASTLAFQKITTIRARAFQGCVSLTKIHISKSMFANANGVGIEPHAFNYCASKSVLDFYFYGTDEKINAWLTNHPNWGWYSDRGDPSIDTYTIKERETGETYFTSDWTYTVSEGPTGDLEATITGYNGPEPTEGYISIPSFMPTPAGNVVTKISATALDSVKGVIERLYLPTTLVEIGNGMFKSGYNKLFVIDDNTACKTDSITPPTTGRIDLSGLDNLEYIGSHAFAKKSAGIGTDSAPIGGGKYRDLITEIHLPAHLRAVGDEAFGVFGQSMFPKVTEFTWGYDSESKLEVVGTDCFFALGITGASGDIKGNQTWSAHTSSTLVFPKTFRYFGMTATDKANFNNGALYTRTFNFNLGGEQPEKGDRPAHAFEGCSLIKRVVFKGGTDSANLIIPLQTFVYSESLQEIVFEERPGKYIAFHTQQGAGGTPSKPDYNYNDYAQESIGGNSGRDKNDFRGEPFLQSLFLPNKTTTLFIQSFAFHANARGVIYLSDEYGHNMYADKTRYAWPDMINNSATYSWSTAYGVDDASNGAKQWRTIGNEEWYASSHNARYYGYCFSNKKDTKITNLDSMNTFSLDQKMPYYENVCYEDVITGDEFIEENTPITFGTGNETIYKEQNKCSFICETKEINGVDTNVATMTNYLFNIRDGSTSVELKTCVIPETITIGSTDYTVTEIGESAFSSCFCNGEDTSPKVAVNAVNNIQTVKMPDTIEKIGDYAFIRAYGVQKIESYTASEDTSELGDSSTERMPKSLKHIGKNAFIFSGIKKVLEIPFKCKFYENESNDYKIQSVFANALSLRKITFIDYDASTPAEQNYSDYYETTTYTSTAGPVYTSAIYSTDSSDLSYKKNRLLVVLNRDKDDRKKVSEDHNHVAECTTYDSSGVSFNGLNKTNPFVYGAYKMGYWIRQISWNNNATVNGETSGTMYAQALFSAVGKYNNSEFVDDYIFLGEACSLYSGLTCDLKSITGINNVETLPKYGFDGCEQLVEVNLPNQSEAVVPDGVFINGGNSVNYKTVTPASPEGATNKYLDLTGTGYTNVGKESFKNNPNLTNFIAPANAFTVGESAFASCKNLATVDFSAVTGTLTLEKNAFNGCKITSITWPSSSSCKVIIKDGAFSSNTSLTSVSLPANLYSDTSTKQLAQNVFSGCTSLTTVNGTANSVDITKIGDSAFSGCTSLTNFDFDIFTSSLTTIGSSAFASCNTVSNSGDISLPSNITTLGGSAFTNSKIVTMTINSSSIKLGEGVFNKCTSLTAFRFTDHDCSWANTYNKTVFNGCTALTELQLSTGFLLSKNFADNNFINGDTNINIYTYQKYTGQSSHDSWRKTSSGIVKDVHFLVTSVQDLIDGTVVESGELKDSIWFWTVDSSGHAVRLGKVTAYDSGTGTVTFSGAGTTYTLVGTTFSPAIP